MNLIRSCSKRNFVLFCASYFGIEGLIGPPPARAEGVAVTGRVAITQGVGEAKRSTNSSTVVWLTPRGDSPGAESRDFCNIHPEMSAIVIVVRSPYYGVSDKSGEITIPNVLPGRYLLRVWHESASPEVLEGLTREITVSDDSASFGTLRLKKAGSLKLAHKNLYGRDYEPPTPPSPLYDQP